MRVCHVITSLETGGAQRVMLDLIARTSARGTHATVISLTGEGPVGERLRAMGVPVQTLGRSTPFPSPVRLARLIARNDPDVVQTWLYRADLLGALVRFMGARQPLVWGIHGTTPLQLRFRTSAIVRANSVLSRFAPRAIVYCSEHARAQHVRIGYAPEKGHVIPNGVDTARFRPDPEARSAIRKELGLDGRAMLIGLVARLDAVKGHETFFSAAGALHQKMPAVHFVLCGDGIEPGSRHLANMIRRAGVEHVTHLLGTRDDVHRITAALDIATSTSVSESFSLTLAEAMACGVPCVSTDCGGPGELMNGLGHLVPIADAQALCRGWMEILRRPPEALRANGIASRQHVERHYSVERAAEAYHRLYGEIGASPPEGSEHVRHRRTG